MSITLKTITGTIVAPGTSTGIRGVLTATPATTSTALTFPGDGTVSLGPVTATTDASGVLPSTFKIPTNPGQSGVIWQFKFQPSNRRDGLPGLWVMGYYEITGTGTVDLADLVAVDVTSVSVTMLDTVAGYAADAESARDAAVAVGSTNDTIMASRANDPASAFRSALNTKYAKYANHGGFLLATFSGNNGVEQAMSVYSSTNGVDFRAHGRNPVYVSPTGGARDAALLYRNDTWYAAISTTSATVPTATSFQILRSTDPMRPSWLVHTTVDATAATNAVSKFDGNPYVWAPTLFVDDDGTVYVYVAINQQYLFVAHALTADLTSWSAFTQLSITGVPGNAIDAHMFKIGSTYHLHYKRNDNGEPWHATSTSPTGPFAGEGRVDWAGYSTPSGDGYEGPWLTQVGPNKWRLYLDVTHGTHGLGFIETTDPNLAHNSWGAMTYCTLNGEANNGRLRHGSVIALDSADTLAAAVNTGTTPAPVSGVTYSTIAKKSHNSGDVTISQNSPGWAAIDTATDLTLGPCLAGDWIELGFYGLWNAVDGSIPEGKIAVVTKIGTTVVNYITPAGYYGNGYPSLFSATNETDGHTDPIPIAVTDYYQVQLGDIDPATGKVTLSLVGQANYGTRVLAGQTWNGFTFWARKH